MCKTSCSISQLSDIPLSTEAQFTKFELFYSYPSGLFAVCIDTQSWLFLNLILSFPFLCPSPDSSVSNLSPTYKERNSVTHKL